MRGLVAPLWTADEGCQSHQPDKDAQLCDAARQQRRSVRIAKRAALADSRLGDERWSGFQDEYAPPIGARVHRSLTSWHVRGADFEPAWAGDQGAGADTAFISTITGMQDLSDYLKAVIESHLDGDASRFGELWDRIPQFGEKLRSIAGFGGWLQWSPQSFDGWYCIQTAAGYDVYYKERGATYTGRTFSSERNAVEFMLRESGTLQ